jgi:hypothetical protein
VCGGICRAAFILAYSREFRVKVNLTTLLSKWGIDWMSPVFVYLTADFVEGHTLEFTFQSYFM